VTPGRHGWQLERTSAELYERLLVPTVTLPWAHDLVDRVGLRPGERVLDVACGTGAVARVAAPDVGEGGRVAALDVNRGMLAVGRSLPPPAGASIEWHEGSADALPFGDCEFDVVLCQLGLQFFPDGPAALRELRRVLAAGGRAGVSVYSSIDRNPAARALASALDRQFADGASSAKRSEHALADPQQLRESFAMAGFVGVEIQTVTQTVRFASVDEWVRIQLSATPLAALVADRDVTRRERVVVSLSTAVGEAMTDFASDNAFVFPQEAHVVLASASPA